MAKDLKPPFDKPYTALKALGENFDNAKKALAQAPKPTQALTDAVQAHGLALYQWMKDNWADIYNALEEQNSAKEEQNAKHLVGLWDD